NTPSRRLRAHARGISSRIARRLAWFNGSGPEFIDASRGTQPAGTVQAPQLSSACASMRSPRRSGTDTVIETHTLLGRAEVDTAGHCRLGRPINSELPGDDRPGLVAGLYTQADALLNAG